MTGTTGQGPERRSEEHIRHDPTDLDHLYGRIGISAVAAALHYTESNKPVDAPAASKIDWRFVEAAA